MAISTRRRRLPEHPQGPHRHLPGRNPGRRDLDQPRRSRSNKIMKSAYELAMERLEKKAPTKKLTEKQKKRIAEINSLYGSKIAERETFLQGEIVKEKAKGDMAAVAQIQDQLSREVRRLHVEWEGKKAAVHGEPTEYESEVKRIEKETPPKK